MQDDEGWARLGTVSWKRLCSVLLLVLIAMQAIVIAFYHDAMYSPLNSHANPKRSFHTEILEQAQQYVDSLPSNTMAIGDPLIFKNMTSSVERAIVIPTSQRKQRYLDVCLWSLFQYNSPASFDSTTLTLINTARRTGSNVDLDRWRQKFTATEWSHPMPIQILNATGGDGAATRWVRLGVIDYVQSLKECMRQQPLWCIILEEDVVLQRNFLSTFRKVVQHPMTPTRTRRKKIGMVRLFVSDYWDGFSSSWVHLRDVVFVAASALVFLLVLLRFCLLPSSAPVLRQRNRAARCKCFSSYVVCVVGFYIICRSMGRQALVNVMERPRSIHLDAIGPTAGAVGTAFPATALSPLCDFLEQRLAAAKGVNPIDVLFNEWIEESSFKTLRTRPSLVQHMGLYSSASMKNQGSFHIMKQDSSFSF